MAKTKLQKPRKIGANNNNNSIEDIKKSLDGGLYLHSSPPKVVNNPPGNSKIREFIRAGDVHSLEELLLAGYGPSLLNQPSTDRTVRNFLKTVPAYMNKIDLVHDAVDRGNLRDLKALLDRRKLSRSRDSQGMGLLHKAVLNGNKDIVDYLLYEYPESANIVDNRIIEDFRKSSSSETPEKHEEEEEGGSKNSAEETPISNEIASINQSSNFTSESSDTPPSTDSLINPNNTDSSKDSGKSNNNKKSDSTKESKPNKLNKTSKSQSSKDYYLFKNANLNRDTEVSYTVAGQGAIPKRRASVSPSQNDDNDNKSRGKGIPLFGGEYIVVNDELSGNNEIEIATLNREGLLTLSHSEINLTDTKNSKKTKDKSKTHFLPRIFTRYSDDSMKIKSPLESRLSSAEKEQQQLNVGGRKTNHPSTKLKISDSKIGKLINTAPSASNSSSSSSTTSLNILTRLPPIGSEFSDSLKKTGEDRPPTPCFIPANVNTVNSLPEISEQSRNGTYRPLLDCQESLVSQETIFEENEDKVDNVHKVDEVENVDNSMEEGEKLSVDESLDTVSTPVDEEKEPEYIPAFLDTRTSFTDRFWSKIFSKAKPVPVFNPNEVPPSKKSSSKSKRMQPKPTLITPLKSKSDPTEAVVGFDQVMNKSPSARSRLFVDPNEGKTSSSNTPLGDKTNDIISGSEITKSLLKFILKLTNTIMIESYNDCSIIFSKSIQAHYAKMNTYQMIYDHDCDFWANVIVEKTLEEIHGYKSNTKINQKISKSKVRNDSIVHSHRDKKVQKARNKINIDSNNKTKKISKYKENKNQKSKNNHDIISKEDYLIPLVLENKDDKQRLDLITFATKKIITEKLRSRPNSTSSTLNLFI